jgi:hypothetical protein
MDAPAQTVNYMLAGYIIIFGTLIGYVISLIIRTQKKKQELRMLKKN